MTARYIFRIDEDTRSIRVTSSGDWAAADFDRYATHFRNYLQIARRRFGSARVLVDGRAATISEVDVRKGMASLADLFTEPGDRFAVITPSSLRKQQATRDGLPASGMSFISKSAAETWLFAHD